MPVKFPLLLALLIWLTGCSLLPEEEDKTKNWSAQKLYTEAKSALDSENYDTAIQYYEFLEARYPFGRFATQGQLDLAYAYYRDDEPESAIATAERFIKLYPNDPAAAYAYYLRGLVNFTRNLGFIERFLPTDSSQRDPNALRQSLNDFAELVRQFPDSEYAQDARQRIIYLQNNLARHEIHVARYYYERGAYIAAANRAQTVITQYSKTPALREALEILIASYQAIGKTQLAADAQRILALNLERGTFIEDPLVTGEKSLGQEIWDFIGLDKD